MKTRILFIAALLIGCIACTPEVQEDLSTANSGMVIEAYCGVSTRTDISFGSSEWLPGDEISVFYNGNSYKYKTIKGGKKAKFISSNGIENYDPSKSLTAWYPAISDEGEVSVSIERDIVFTEGTQTMIAQAPLAGTVESVSGSVLKIGFRNICSIVELRLDAGSPTEKVKSLTLSPVKDSDFEGYLSFQGKVDPTTLAVTPDVCASTLTLNLPDNTDLTGAQVYKFPVGRFIAPQGLELLLVMESGRKISRTIFSNGLKSYSYDGQIYTVKHYGKDLYPFLNETQKGISTVDDLLAFAQAVNSSADLSKWTGSDGVVALLNDLDLSNVKTWTPIGVCHIEYPNNTLTMTGTPFKGHFDGRGHSLHNLDMVCTNATAGNPWGFFGGISDGAIVENLVFANDCSLTVSPSAQTDCGILAGIVKDATVRNVTNNAPMTYVNAKVADNNRMTMAMVGLAYSNKKDSKFEGLINRGFISVEKGNNTQNNASAVQTAGICGFASNQEGSTCVNMFLDCANYGNQNGNNGRAAGLIATCNRYTVLMNCENHGDTFNTSTDGRLGNITCVTGTGVEMDNVANYGDYVSTQAQPVGGCICLVNHDNNVFLRLANYGKVITDRADSYFGTLFGQCKKAASFTSCIAAGDLGTYNNGSYNMKGINASNYFDFVGTHSSAGVNVTKSNILYSSAATLNQFPSKWVLSSDNQYLYSVGWKKIGRIPATQGDAYISVERAAANADKAFTYTIASNGVPEISTLAEGDSWVYTVPGVDLPSGSYIDFNTTFVSYAKSAKYFIAEILDGDSWKAPKNLPSVKENTSLKYSAICSGQPYGDDYQHSTLMQTFRLDNPVKGDLKIRCRVVGPYACDGSTLTTESGGITRFGPHPWTGAYIQNYGTKAPIERRRVLFLGNSFFYYHTPVWVLKELAFAEGLELEVNGFFKGNQSFEGINNRPMTQEAIDRGGYEFAFFLGETYEEADYADNPNSTASKAIAANIKELSNKIRAVSPSCRVFLVSTWAYGRDNYEGYGSYKNFSDLLLSGTKMLAQLAGDEVSPVSKAFAIIHNEQPKINLYDTDEYHQGPLGAYLEACVNYLVISGRRFGSSPTDCGLDPSITAKLRDAAERAVFGN